MKVALFTNAYLPYLSGITLSIKTLKDELRARGHTVFIVGPKYPGHKEHDPQILRLPSLPATYPGYRFVFPYSHKAFKLLKEKKIDIIHAHQPFGVGTAARLLARRMKIPFVYSFHTLFSRYVHNVPFLPQGIAKSLITAYLTSFCQKTDLVIVPSEMVRRLLVLRGVKRPIRVIPTGIVLQKIRERKGTGTQRMLIRKKYRLPEDAKLLLYSGRLSREKNVPFLLNACAKILSREQDTYLLLIGGGPQEKELRTLGKKLSNKIIFTGQIAHSEVIDHCFASDIFVYASITETQGLVLTEAKACGLPVVAVFGGGVSDVVESGIDGYLVPHKEGIFIDHVLRLLKNPQLRKGLSQKAVEDSHLRFSSVMVAKEIENVYNSLIEMKPLDRLGAKE
ncbi:MAG: glycosyltransferase [Candidatus Margulisiibacteriota bacterium]|nr:glycosyltransferase [Candidatus Margulisiibacteriota bacterium]